MKLFRARVVFKRLPKDALGQSYIDEKVDIIELDLAKHDRTNIARTYVHEQLHLAHPEWSETKVLREERRIWKAMSTKQKLAVYRRIFRQSRPR